MTKLTRAFLFLILTVLRSEADGATVHARAMTAPSIAVARIAAGPTGTLACLDWKTHGVRVVTPQGRPADVDLAIPAGAQITGINGGDGQTVITTVQHGTFVLSRDGSVRARFAGTRFAPYLAATTDRDSAFGLGSAGDENGIHTEWLVTRVDLQNPSVAPHDLVEDEAFADPFARSIYPLGYLLLSANRSTLYALWEGSPVLHLIPTAGGAVRAVTLTSGMDAPPRATPALRSAALSDRSSFYELRSRYRWPQGLLRGPNDSVAVLFREPASRGSAFTVDLYSREGKKVAASLPVDLGPRSATAHARTVVATDGKQYVLLNEPTADFSGVQNQRLYAIDVRP